MAATRAETEVMSIKELQWAVWRAEAAAIAWVLFAIDGGADLLRQMGMLADLSPVEVGVVSVLLNVVAVIVGVLRARSNFTATKRIRAALHQARVNRPLFDRYR